MPYVQWHAATTSLERIRIALLESEADLTHAATERVVRLLCDDRNPLAAGLALGRIADEMPLMPAIQLEMLNLADLLRQYLGVRRRT